MGLNPKPIIGLPPEWIFHDELAIPVDAIDMIWLAEVAVAMERAGYADEVNDPAVILLFCLRVVAEWHRETGKVEMDNGEEED